MEANDLPSKVCRSAVIRVSSCVEQRETNERFRGYFRLWKVLRDPVLREVEVGPRERPELGRKRKRRAVPRTEIIVLASTGVALPARRRESRDASYRLAFDSRWERSIMRAIDELIGIYRCLSDTMGQKKI